ncbi:MAG: response regulator [Phycisphaerae bacterium]|nr:response regulator [Phycisphaerae bacterium]
MVETRILVVEDELIVAKDIQRGLEDCGFCVPAVAASGEDAVRLAGEHRPNLVLMDIVLDGEMDGIEAAERIHRSLDIPVVYLTAHGDEATADRAHASKPYGYVLKPYDEQCLCRTIRTALDRHGRDRREFSVRERMIRDMRAYLYAGSKRLDLRPVDCNVVFAEALGGLAAAIEAAGAKVARSVLPTVVADPAHMVLVFRHLIDNAIKFRSQEVPAVRVDARRQEDYWLFRVQDNGIGIDPSQADRVFDVLGRARAQDAQQGTGVGLAICKKIIERHGGSMWVRSAPGKGAAFCFTIPAD